MTYTLELVNRGGVVLEIREDQTIIEACEAAGIALPIACRYGGCVTCAARLRAGRVRQPGATAINARQNRLGYILTCVARPKSDLTLEVGVECQDELYRNPFAAPDRRR